jgi:hypothetical protein
MYIFARKAAARREAMGNPRQTTSVLESSGRLTSYERFVLKGTLDAAEDGSMEPLFLGPDEYTHDFAEDRSEASRPRPKAVPAIAKEPTTVLPPRDLLPEAQQIWLETYPYKHWDREDHTAFLECLMGLADYVERANRYDS